VLSLFGVAGLVVAQGSLLGRLGRFGVVLTVPGLVAFACVAWYEGVVMPVIVRQDPHLLAWDGPPLARPAMGIVSTSSTQAPASALPDPERCHRTHTARGSRERPHDHQGYGKI
jgi:hypothetical protein